MNGLYVMEGKCMLSYNPNKGGRKKKNSDNFHLCLVPGFKRKKSKLIFQFRMILFSGFIWPIISL